MEEATNRNNSANNALRLFAKSFNYDIMELRFRDSHFAFAVIEKLANGEPLDAKYRDHDLTGNYKGCRECHVEPDWLLIYEIIDDIVVLLLYRVGSHSELFKK